uniref:Uncharacterized protein n=1 Tax=Takifugu rubripes TaxID=31033 RepID=A0A674N3C1_TAKRU
MDETRRLCEIVSPPLQKQGASSHFITPAFVSSLVPSSRAGPAALERGNESQEVAAFLSARSDLSQGATMAVAAAVGFQALPCFAELSGIVVARMCPCAQPSGLYAQPSGLYAQPSGLYAQPSGLYAQPAGLYAQPSGLYAQPAGLYAQPAGLYAQPSGLYAQPAGLYAQPSGLYAQPSGLYAQPAGLYAQPSGLYAQPSGLYAQPSGLYAQPAGLYAQPYVVFTPPLNYALLPRRPGETQAFNWQNS